jgi:hypothetical protein
MTTANLRPSYSVFVSAFERSELDVSIESETITQTARGDAGERAGSLAVTTEISFGSFRLLPAQRLLLDGNKPVQ